MKILSLIVAQAISIWVIGASATEYSWVFVPSPGDASSGVIYSSDPNFWSDSGIPDLGSYFTFTDVSNTVSIPLQFAFVGAVGLSSPDGHSYLNGASQDLHPPNPFLPDIIFSLGSSPSYQSAYYAITPTTGFEIFPRITINTTGNWEPAPIPEPSTLLLFSLPTLGLVTRRFRSKA